MAVENCLNAYQATGHTGFVIDDTRAHREFRVEREVLLQLLFLRHQDRTRYFEILNLLDRQGGQDELVSFLAAHARIRIVALMSPSPESVERDLSTPAP